MNRLQTHFQLENLYDQIRNLVHTFSAKPGKFKTELIDISNQYLSAPGRQWFCLSPQHRGAFKELKVMKDLVISQSNIRSGVVIMDKMNKIPDDVQQFKSDYTPENCILIEEHVSRELQVLPLHAFAFEFKPIGT